MMPESPDLFEVLWELVLRTFYDAFVNIFGVRVIDFFADLYSENTCFAGDSLKSSNRNGSPKGNTPPPCRFFVLRTVRNWRRLSPWQCAMVPLPTCKRPQPRLR